MELKTKKIIAREFLYFVLTLVIGLVSFLGSILYNKYQSKERDDLSKQISILQKQSDSLKSFYRNKNEKQYWYFNNYRHYFETNDNMNTQSEFWNFFNNKIKKDSIKLIWTNDHYKDLVDFNNNLNFQTPEQLIEFILANNFTSLDMNNDKEGDSLKLKVNTLVKLKNIRIINLYEASDQKRIVINGFTLAVILLFLLRYFIKALKWSFKTVRQKEI